MTFLHICVYTIKICDCSVDARALNEKACLIISNMLDSYNICSANCVGAFAELQACWSAGSKNALPSSSTL